VQNKAKTGCFCPVFDKKLKFSEPYFFRINSYFFRINDD